MRSLLLLTLFMLPLSTQASSIKLDYSVFFGYIKSMYKLDYQHVTTAFYLVDRDNKQLCNISNAQIVVDNNYEPIQFESTGRLLPFYSDQHRKDGAALVVDIVDNKTISSCDLKVTVMAKRSELANLSTARLALISEQLEGVLKENAGMFGKYFLPSFAGIRLQFSAPLTEQQARNFGHNLSLASNGDLLIKNAQIANITLNNELHPTLLRITPWMLNK